jgi:SAM-dependent methyltransferase
MSREKLTTEEMCARAAGFQKEFEAVSCEINEAQAFVTSLLHVFGIPNPCEVGEFGHPVRGLKKSSLRMDYLWKGVLGVVMKAKGMCLPKEMEQLERNVARLHPDEAPELMLVCDFTTIFLKNRDSGDGWTFDTRELDRHLKLFSPLAGQGTPPSLGEQAQADSAAVGHIARLHDSLKRRGYDGHSLEVCLVRLLFCMFAEDTGVFPENVFREYIDASRPDGSDLAGRLGMLFEHLDTPDEERDAKAFLPAELRQFSYVDGGLFKERIPQADFDRWMRKALLDCASFDWNAISPAVFGSMFQGVMSKEKRRETGVHYTSEYNIIRLMGPLFLDELRTELQRSIGDPVRLKRFLEGLKWLRFLDPACGCGNFLIVAYRELRRLELEAIAHLVSSAALPLDTMSISVILEHFSGIEIEDFPCQVPASGCG